MIVWDTETTGLLEASLSSPDRQPRIVEFAAVKLLMSDEGDWVIDGKLHFICNPGIPLDPKAAKYFDLTNEFLATQPKFITQLRYIQDFFLGERQMAAHNLTFDRGVLAEELKRVDRLLHFPWPIEHLCTTELTQDLHLKDRKLMTLYEHYMKTPLKQTHRAMDDVMALCQIVSHMHTEGRL